MTRYRDIIDHPGYHLRYHYPMSMYKRAAQFSSFAALTGFEDEIDEVRRPTDSWVVADESTADMIDRKLRLIRDKLQEREQPFAKIVYFVRDDKKEGGRYVRLSAYIRRIDDVSGIIETTERISVSIRDICNIEGDIFEQTDDE